MTDYQVTSTEQSDEGIVEQRGTGMTFRCIKPNCPPECSMCNYAVPEGIERKLYDVYCEGRWVTYEWAYSAKGAIRKAQDGLGEDNCVWTAETQQ